MTTAPNGELRRQDFHLQVQQLVSLRSLPWVAWVSLPHVPWYYTTYDCHRPFSGSFACRSFPDTWRASLVRGVPVGLVARRKLPVTPGPLVTRSPTPGLSSRRPMALPSSRVPPVKPCPALRPRWGPAHSPKRTQDCCLPATEHRRLTTTLSISGLHHAACLLATPGSVRPLTGRHAGSLLTCWLGFNQVGLAPEVLTYWGTTTSFMGLRPVPRFRAYLGAISG